ncbi:hypothetical protein T10_4646 [Trichinella papuae]|uniref:Uncharacterized protein n=1 Tax=Trichinella papuae TaxID=268474 RepID=A0A0V1MDJ7_9BILA|nr:hypothetical protein T10_4646 [Trichinella papuae]
MCYSPLKLTFSSVINADPFLMKLFCLEDSSNIQPIPERERTIGVDEGLNRLKNVKVSFQLPVAAANRLQRLNAQEPSCLRSIGILAVHVGGEHEEHDVGNDDARLIPSFSGATRQQSCEADSLATSLLRHCYSNSINNETNKRKTAAAHAGNGLQSRSVSSAKTSDSGISAGSNSPLLVGLLLQSGFSDGTAETSSVNISEDRSWLAGKVEGSAAPVSKRRRGSRIRKETLSPTVLNHPLKQRQQHRQLCDDSSQAREKREAIMDEVIQSVVSDMKAYNNNNNNNNNNDDDDDDNNNNNESDFSVKNHGELESNSVALSDEQSGTNSNNFTDLNCHAEQQMLSTDANVELPSDAVQLNAEDSESMSRTILPADDLSRLDSSCLVDSNCTSSTLSNVDGTEQVDKAQLSADIVPSEDEVDGQYTMTNGERGSTTLDVRLSNGPALGELENKNEDELAANSSQSDDNFEQQQQPAAESKSIVVTNANVMVDDCFSDRNRFLLHAVQSDHDYTEPSLLLRHQGTTAGCCSYDQQHEQEHEQEQQQLKSRLSTTDDDDDTVLPAMSSLTSGSDSCTAKGRVLDTSVELLSDQGQGQCQWPLQTEISSLQQQNVGSSS